MHCNFELHFAFFMGKMAVPALHKRGAQSEDWSDRQFSGFLSQIKAQVLSLRHFNTIPENRKMIRHGSLRQEVERLRAEIEDLRTSKAAASQEMSSKSAGPLPALERQIADLNQLVQDMLDEAEDAVAGHPVATVAGALALGIIIGRLTSR